MKVIETIEELIYAGKYAQGVEMLESEQKQFLKHLGQPIHVQYLLTLGHLFMLRRRMTESGEQYEAASEIIETHGKGDKTWDMLRQKHMWLDSRRRKTQGDQELAQTLLEMALTIRKEKDIITGEVMVDLAAILGEMGELEESINYYNRGVKILQEHGNDWKLGRAYTNLSDAYLKVERWNKALETAKLAAKHSLDSGNNRIAAFALLNGAEAQVRAGKLDGAKKMLKEAEDTMGPTSEKYFIGYLDYTTGLVESKSGNYEHAEQAFDSAVDMFEETDHFFFLGKVLEDYGLMMFQMGQMSMGKAKLQESLKVLRDHGCHEEARIVEKQLQKWEAVKYMAI